MEKQEHASLLYQLIESSILIEIEIPSSLAELSMGRTKLCVLGHFFIFNIRYLSKAIKFLNSVFIL